MTELNENTGIRDRLNKRHMDQIKRAAHSSSSQWTALVISHIILLLFSPHNIY